MSEEKNYKYSIGFTQSVSSGFIGFHGSYQFDNEDEFLHSDNGAKFMRDMLDSAERIFKQAGYKIAKDIEPKEKKIEKETNA